MAEVKVVFLPAVGICVTLAQYVAGVKLAKAHPDSEFKHGLTTWWPTKGSEILRQFMDGVHDRINRRGGFDAKKGYDPRYDRRVLRRLKEVRVTRRKREL